MTERHVMKKDDARLRGRWGGLRNVKDDEEVGGRTETQGSSDDPDVRGAFPATVFIAHALLSVATISLPIAALARIDTRTFAPDITVPEPSPDSNSSRRRLRFPLPSLPPLQRHLAVPRLDAWWVEIGRQVRFDIEGQGAEFGAQKRVGT